MAPGDMAQGHMAGLVKTPPRAKMRLNAAP
jgi:hypothetical protein